MQGQHLTVPNTGTDLRAPAILLDTLNTDNPEMLGCSVLKQQHGPAQFSPWIFSGTSDLSQHGFGLSSSQEDCGDLGATGHASASNTIRHP
jgi:hypothetical protein